MEKVKKNHTKRIHRVIDNDNHHHIQANVIPC